MIDVSDKSLKNNEFNDGFEVRLDQKAAANIRSKLIIITYLDYLCMN